MNDYDNALFEFTLLKETISKITLNDCFLMITIWYPVYHSGYNTIDKKSFLYDVRKDMDIDELFAASLNYIKNDFVDFSMSIVYPLNNEDYMEIVRLKKNYNTYPEKISEIIKAMVYNKKDIIDKYQEIFDKFIVEVI